MLYFTLSYQYADNKIDIQSGNKRLTTTCFRSKGKQSSINVLHFKQ